MVSMIAFLNQGWLIDLLLDFSTASSLSVHISRKSYLLLVHAECTLYNGERIKNVLFIAFNLISAIHSLLSPYRNIFENNKCLKGN